MNASEIIPFQVFGSSDSIDFDVVFFVSEIKSVHQNLTRAKNLASHLTNEFTNGRKINANLAKITDGVISEVYKGTPDELNNALFQTYTLNHQIFDNHITRLLTRDIDLKLFRTLRKTLSFFTRTAHRSQIKQALKSGFSAQLRVLQTIDFTDLRTDDDEIRDIWKIIVFSMIQSLALAEGTELYTKQSIVNYSPGLKPVIYREAGKHRLIIREVIDQFITLCEQSIAK